MALYVVTLPKGNPFPVSHTIYADAGHTLKVLESLATWDGPRLLTEVHRVYAPDGVTVERTTTYTYDYASGLLSPDVTVTT